MPDPAPDTVPLIDIAPRHLRGVVGASTVRTPGLRAIELAVRSLFDDGGIVLVDGKVGVGKTYATDYVLQSMGIPIYWTDMADTSRGREANAKIYEAVAGKRPSLRMNSYALTAETVDLLDNLRAVLVVDEAPNMTVSAMRQLRYLHDRPTTKVLMVLIGAKVINTVTRVPELDSRVSRRITVNELTKKEALELVPKIHPVLANTDAKVLADLSVYAKGNLRNWAHILEVANHGGVDPEEGIDPEMGRIIISALSGGARRREAS